MNYSVNPWPQVANGLRSGRLVRATFGSCASGDDKNVEDGAEGGKADENARDCGIDSPEVVGKSAAEKQRRSLQHQWQCLHHTVEIPRDNTIELALPVLATFYGRPSQVGRCVSVQPLFAEHRKEGGEEGSGKARVKNGLDLNNRTRGAGPLWNSGSFGTEGSVINLMDEDSEEGGRLLTHVRLKLRLDVDDERGSDRRKQTGL